MKLIKIHKILKIKQTYWTKMQNAKNKFEKSLYKLTNNSAYGKTMENLR